MENIGRGFSQVFTEGLVYRIIFELKPKNFQCQQFKFSGSCNGKNMLNIGTIHRYNKSTQNKKALQLKGLFLKNHFLFYDQFTGHGLFLFRYLKYVHPRNQSGYV